MTPLVVLLLAVACSGAAGLTYQVLWLRQLSLVFGVTAYAASTVLAGFMAGLALGSLGGTNGDSALADRCDGSPVPRWRLP